MREPITLDKAEYKSGLAYSLWEDIRYKACKECSPVLVDLLSLACDINHEVHQSLALSQGRRYGQSDNDDSDPCRERADSQRVSKRGSEYVD